MLLTALASIIVLTCAACYVWSVSLGHVPAAFPYISETGSKDPESCLFGLGLNIAAFLYAIAVYLRYRELIVFRSMFPDCRISARVNRYSLWLGLVSAFGLAVVASFQVGRVKIPHFVGAALIFFGGNLYFAVQAFFSHRMWPAVSSRAMVRLRVVLTILAAVALTLTIVCGFFAVSDFTGDDDTQWYPDDGGYEMHVLSAAMEYATAAMFVASIVTYIPEMRIISISPPALRILLLESVIATKPAEKY